MTYNKGAKALDVDDRSVDPDHLEDGKIQVDMTVLDGRDLDKQCHSCQEKVYNVLSTFEEFHGHGQAYQESDDNVHRKSDREPELYSIYLKRSVANVSQP